MDAAGSADNDVCATWFELFDIIFDDCATDASLNFDVLILADGVDDVSNLHGEFASGWNNKSLAVVRYAALRVSINALEHTNSEGTSFTSTRLGLSDGIFALDKGQDTFALDGGGVLKTITVDSSKDTLLQAHVVKLINFQVPVRFENLFNYLILIIVNPPNLLDFALLSRSL